MILLSAFIHDDEWNPQLKNHTVVPLDNHSMLLFGGYDGNHNCGKTYILDINTKTWTETQTTGTAPSRRNGHSALVIGNKMIVIGGWDSSCANDKMACSDVFQLDFDTWKWSKCPVELSCNMSTVVYAQELIYIFRGGDGANYHNDMYTIHPTTFELKTVETHGTSPSVRANCAGVILGDYMYIVGGWNGSNRLNDMHRFHIPTCTWETMAPFAEKIAGATLTHYRIANQRDYLVLCGGSAAHSNTNYRIYLYDISRNEWHAYTPLSLSLPNLAYRGRNGHCAVAMLPDQPQIMMIGGSVINKYPRSTLLFDLSKIEPDVRVDRIITPEFSSFFDNARFSDFRLHFKGEIIHAHRIVLSRNDWFRANFSWPASSTDEILDLVIDEEDISFKSFSEMVRFIYVGEIEIEETFEQIKEMLYLAQFYQIPGLKQYCEVILKKQVTADNVLSILEWARHYDANQLIVYCIYFHQL